MDRFENNTGFLLKHAWARAAAVSAAVFPAGSHPRDAGVLATLAAAGPSSQQQLAARLNINRTMMVKRIDELEGQGFVERRRNPFDRRSYALHVTDAGHAALRAMAEPMERAEAQLSERLSDAERARLSALLTALIAPPPPEMANVIGFLLARAHHRFHEQADAALRPLGIEIRAFSALAVLAAGTPSQRELADRLRVSTPVVVEVVDGLEARGLVERRRAPADRRSNQLHVTPAGEAVLASGGPELDAIRVELTRPIGVAGERELGELLRKLLDYA